MLKEPRQSIPPVALGVTSVILATISLLLFLLPVLSVPIATCGLGLAVAGTISVIWRPKESLRWSLAGMFGSLAALAVALAINFAPVGEEPHPEMPSLWQQPPIAPFVPPPARPRLMEDVVPKQPPQSRPVPGTKPQR